MAKRIFALLCVVGCVGVMHGMDLNTNGMDANTKKHFAHNLKEWEKHGLERGWHEDLGAEDAPQLCNKEYQNDNGGYHESKSGVPKMTKSNAAALVIQKQIEINNKLAEARIRKEQFEAGWQL